MVIAEDAIAQDLWPIAPVKQGSIVVATGDSLSISAGYRRILDASSEAEVLRLEATELVETDKTSDFDDSTPKEFTIPEDDSEELLRTGTQKERVLLRARRELGYREGPNNDTKYGKWYGLDHRPWCAMMVSWVFYHEGLPLPATTPMGFARTLYGAQWFQRRNRWTTTPARGHIVFFDLSSNVESIDHCGIVDRVNADGTITTIEGNTSRGGSREGEWVYVKTRKKGIVGYGIPEYSEISIPPWPGRVLKYPPVTKGDHVRQWQQRVKDRGWRRMAVDGTYDALDDELCRAFQKEKGLEVDGQVGPSTWAAAWTAPIT